MFKKLTLCCVAALLAASCGGGSNAPAEDPAAKAAQIADLRAKALDLRARALANAPAGPCETTSQCRVLTLFVETDVCQLPTFHAYTSQVTTAEMAAELARQQREAVGQAASLAAPQGAVCPAIAYLPAPMACVAGACRLGN